MKASEELSKKKLFLFLFYSFAQIVYSFCFLPPLRKIFLSLLNSKIGKDSIIMNIHFFNWHHKGPKGLVIGDECFIGDNTLFDLYDKITLENQVTLAQKVTVLTHLNVGYKNHPLQKYFPKKSSQVVFKKACVVGAGAIILPGITVGQESFVAAGSVVTKNVPHNSLVGGVPARLIKKIK